MKLWTEAPMAKKDEGHPGEEVLGWLLGQGKAKT